jgi:C-1 hydroxylase
VIFSNTTGTQRGVYQGSPPTNNTFVAKAVDLFRFKDGKIVEHWDVVDYTDLLNKIGVISFNR